MHVPLNVKFSKYVAVLMGPVPFQGWPEKSDALAALPPTKKHRIRFEWGLNGLQGHRESLGK